MKNTFLDTKISFPNFTYGDIVSKLTEKGLLADNTTIEEIAEMFEDNPDQMIVAGWSILDEIIDDIAKDEA